MSDPTTLAVGPEPATPKVVAGFFSFTEVEAGAHRSYNEWHLFDHLPEQFVLPGVAGGQRWVLTPAQAAAATAPPPLDHVHYVTLYLLAEPLHQTLVEFQEHGVALARAGRFHQRRTAHLAGPLLVESRCAARRVLVAPGAVPHRPGTGLHVRVLADDADAGRPEDLLDVPGVVGVWSFAGVPPGVPGPFAEAMAGLRVICAWLDGDPDAIDAAMTATVAPATTPTATPAATPAVTATVAPATVPSLPVDAPIRFAATLTTIDPHGPFDWFDR